jgi:hypothetical protein
MFVRVKRSGSHEYLQIVVSRRQGTSVRQRVVATLGRRDELVANGRLDGLLSSLAKFRERPSGAPAAPRPPIRGRAEVRGVFQSGGSFTAGVFVTDGTIARGDRARLVRSGTAVWEGKLTELTRFKQQVNDIATGLEGGVRLEECSNVREKDILESIGTTERPGSSIRPAAEGRSKPK